LRIIISIALRKRFKIIQIDIDAAYLNAEIKEELYMKAPEGYSSYNNTFWKLNKPYTG